MALAGCRGASDAVGAGARVSWTTSFHKTDQAVRLDVPKLGPPVAGQYVRNPVSPFGGASKAWMTPETVVSTFRRHGVPPDVDYVSIDIDSCDLWVFLALTDVYRPRLVSIE